MRSLLVSFVCLLILAPLASGESPRAEIASGFRFIPGGRFIQGTDGGERALQLAFPLSTTGQSFGNAEGPAHVTWVTKPFWISTTEVTVGQFRRFVQETGYRSSAERGLTEMVGWDPTPEDKPLYESHDFQRLESFSWKNPGFPQQDDHPVVGVSWSDAKSYCAWLSKREGVTYRLPTEAEWELACRAGTSTWFSFGDRARGIVHEHANFGNVELEKHRQHAAERQWLLDWENDPEDGFVFTSPVGHYKPNPWGLHDMHGNAWEWCEDLWLDTVYKDYTRPRYDRPTGTAVDPVNVDRPQTPVNDFHTIRGGSWYNGDLICRSANRTYWDAEDAACYIGFRIVRDADPSSNTSVRKTHEAELAAIETLQAAGGRIYSSRGIDIDVRFEGDTVDVDAFQHLSALSDLHGLQVRWRNRDQQISQSALNSIAELTNLRSLEFASGLGIEQLDLSVLTRLRHLEVLRFPRDAALNDKHLQSLTDFASLREFRCFGTNGGLTDEGILCLKANRGLQTLQIWESHVRGDFLLAFEGCPLSTLALTALDDQFGSMTDASVDRLIQFPHLQVLMLDGQTQLGGAALLTIGELDQLRELSLQRCSGLSDDDFGELSRLQNLRRLNLLETRAADHAAAAIACIPRIETLRIGSNSSPGSSLSDVGAAELSQAFSLIELQLISNAVTDQGFKSLGYLNRLRELTVKSNQMNGSGLGPITQLPDLRDLSLQTPGLTDVAFDFLSQAKSITKLKLAHRGVRPPAALTNQGLQKMAGATWLQELWIPRNDTGITEDQIKALGQQMPDTGVIPYTVSWKD